MCFSRFLRIIYKVIVKFFAVIVKIVALSLRRGRLGSVRMRWTYRVSIEMVLIFFLAMKQWSGSARSVSTAVAIAQWTLHFYSLLVVFPPLCHKQSSCCIYEIRFNCLLHQSSSPWFGRLRSTLLTLFVEIPHEFSSTKPWIVNFDNKTSQGALNVDIYVKIGR